MIEPAVIIDTGALVAALVERDQFHPWASEIITDLPIPLLTSEAVITEACFLLQRQQLPVKRIFELFQRQSLVVAMDLQVEAANIHALIEKYAAMPNKKSMSLADATLVRLAELHDDASVFTVDNDFRIYRKHGRRQIPLIIPDERR